MFFGVLPSCYNDIMADSQSQRSTFTTGDVLRKLRLTPGNEGDKESGEENPDCTEQDAAAQGRLVTVAVNLTV